MWFDYFALVVLLAASNAFQPIKPSIHRLTKTTIFADGVESSFPIAADSDLDRLKEELAEARAFREQMRQEIEDMEQKVERMNGESKRNMGVADTGKKDLVPLSSRQEALKRQAEEEAVLKQQKLQLEEDARLKAQLEKEAAEASKLLKEEKAMLQQAQIERNALMNKINNLKQEVDTSTQINKQNLKLPYALEAGLCAGFVGAILMSRVFLEDRDIKKDETDANIATKKRTQSVRSTYEIDAIAPKARTEGDGGSYMEALTKNASSSKPNSYSPFGGGTKKVSSSRKSKPLYTPPPTATRTKIKASTRIAAAAAAAEATTIPPSPQLSTKKAVEVAKKAVEAAKKVVEVEKPTIAATKQDTPPSKTNNASSQPNYAIGGASYIETLGGTNPAVPPPTTNSYSPFGSKTKGVASSIDAETPSNNYMDSNSLPPSMANSYSPFGTAPKVVPNNNSIYTPPPVNVNVNAPTSPAPKEDTPAKKSDDYLGEANIPPSMANSYSPFAPSQVASAPQNNDTSRSPVTPSLPQRNGTAPSPPIVQSPLPPPVKGPKKSYLPYGTKPQGKPWWDNSSSE